MQRTSACWRRRQLLGSRRATAALLAAALFAFHPAPPGSMLSSSLSHKRLAKTTSQQPSSHLVIAVSTADQCRLCSRYLPSDAVHVGA